MFPFPNVLNIFHNILNFLTKARINLSYTDYYFKFYLYFCIYFNKNCESAQPYLTKFKSLNFLDLDLKYIYIYKTIDYKGKIK